ncbi:Mu transposase C-terminal domain-containing protein [Bosea sp. (in: a-proteobacteria)]|uniref:Mu transposase C-terminal domain-containing protein n=1 Tax=Bosea sp. (in: a-proteobacteria) TaxID=1871050 RepID=UPI0025C09EC6|nr:Mu transposase C-terminal domain-containing protein [Bosea sp. (in: a-proteobacteria)]
MSRLVNREFKLPEQVRHLIAEHAPSYCDDRKVTGRSIWKKVEEEIAKLNVARAGMNMPALPVPSEKAIYRAIKKLDPFRVMAGREGSEVAQRKFAIVHEGIRPQRLLERVEMDVWKVTITALLVDTETWERVTPVERKQVTRVRCYITAAIDCASRCLLALYLHVDAPSGASSIAALQMITENKARLSESTGLSTVWFMRGRPELLVTDGGPEFKDHRFRGVVADLRVAHQFARPKHPQDRGTIERFFETLEEYLSAEFSGRTFRNVGERGEYEAGDQASLTVDQLREVLPMIVNRYHNTPNEGLGRETPLDAWKRLARECSVRPAPSPSEARNIFGIRTARRISGRGVRFLGLHYQSEDVQELRRTINQREAQIRVDPYDLGEISIQTEKGWVSVKCVEDFAKGVSAAEWIAANARLRQRFAAQAAVARPALMEAIEAIREIARNAHRTAGLKPTVITEGDFKTAEQNLLRTFRIREEAASPATDNDILGLAEADDLSSDGNDLLEEGDEEHDDIAEDGDMSLED